KLNDIKRIESTLDLMDNYAGIPANLWLKYLKILLVVTQTSEERKAFEKKCATALKSEYNIPLAEFVVAYLVDKASVEENHALWAKLLSDYDVERPDFGNKLRALLEKAEDENETSLQVLLKHHCATWECTQEERNTIKYHVVDFEHDLMITQPYNLDWDFEKIHSPNIEEVKSSAISEDVQNAIIRFIFERLVAKFGFDDILWIEYIQFVQGSDLPKDLDDNPDELEKFKCRIGRGYLSNTPLELAKRAVKRFPTARINHRYLHLMEHNNYDQKQVHTELKAMLERTSSEMEITVELHLDYLAYRVRNTKTEKEEQIASLREAFQKAWEELSEWYGDQADTSYEILQLWAQVEYSKLRSPENGEFIWRQILAYPGSSHNGFLWYTFAQMEFQYNSGEKTGHILREALSQPVLKDVLIVHELLRRFERSCGTYVSITECQDMVLPREWRPNPMHAKGRNSHLRQQQEDSSLKQPQPKNQLPKAKKHEKSLAPRPEASSSVAAKPTFKRTNDSEPHESHFKYSTQLETNKIFVKNLYHECTKEELQELFSPFGIIKDVRLVQKQNKQQKGIAYVEFDLPSAAEKAVIMRDGYLLGGIKVSKLRKRIPLLIGEPLQISVMISNPPPRNNQSPSKKWTSSSSDSAKAKVAPKRRMPTTLIPTSVVRKEVAEKKQRLNDNTEGQESKEEPEPNGKIEDSEKDKEEAGTSKSNEDFRKLLNL
ncbi:hypothetical protein KR074_001962, partial [Drosophila pseudoananassae]